MIFIEEIQAGESYRLFFNEGNPNNKVFHVRAIVDDGWYVIRTWSPRKQRWIYSVEPWEYFDSLSDCITVVK